MNYLKYIICASIVLCSVVIGVQSTQVSFAKSSSATGNFSANLSVLSPSILSEDAIKESNIGVYIVTLKNNTVSSSSSSSFSLPPGDQLNFILPKQKITKAVAFQPPEVIITSDDQCYISTSLPFASRSTSINLTAVTDQVETIYVKAKTDNVIEGSHVCNVTHSYNFPYAMSDNFTITQEVVINDFTPGFFAVATPEIYENSKDSTQPNTGEIGIKLLNKPSDLEPVIATLTNQTPLICALNTSQLTFTQENFDTQQAISVVSVKDGVYQAEARDCVIKVLFTSNEGGFTVPAASGAIVPNRSISTTKPRFIKAAQEYNNLSYLATIKVLDTDTPAVVAQKLAAQAELVRTGVDMNQVLLTSLGLVVVLGVVWIAKR